MDMSEVSIEDFLPKVLPYVRGCPDNVALEAIRNAIEEFCKRSTIVRMVHEPVTVVTDQAEYPLEIPYNYYSVEILEAGCGWQPLPTIDTITAGERFGINWRNQTGPISYITQDDNKSFRLVMTPEREYVDPIRMTVALAPTSEATAIRSVVFHQWSEVIAYGARARLHDIPSEQYYDPQQAQKFRMWFDSGCSEAKIAANKSFGKNSSLRVKPRFV